MTFLVSNLHKDIDFKAINESFRALDKHNTGILTLSEIREVLKDSALATKDIDDLFIGLDLNGNGTINYSVFLAATVDKHKALTL